MYQYMENMNYISYIVFNDVFYLLIVMVICLTPAQKVGVWLPMVTNSLFHTKLL